ncbi:origin recognition complex subunit 5-like [Paramacrobiotus metropolitanus]|uniref:origin recognition complex subunit 5-like n=1 Tax=Paramacrobiotus metropolitanus TaxID=2943436 RepID=UPI002445F365|nr:origin recognition complex subunit 5-like [Paramacrobiotus metropolitanus]
MEQESKIRKSNGKSAVDARTSMKTMKFRTEEQRLLQSILTQKDALVKSLIFISGVRGTGKSMLVKTVLDGLPVPSTLVDCTVADTENAVASRIFSLLRHIDDDFSKASEGLTCRKLFDLRKFLRLFAVQKISTLIVVLDGFEMVEKWAFVWSELLKLQKFCLPALKFVVTSRSSVCLLAGTSYNFDDPMQIHLGKYNKDQLIDLVTGIFRCRSDVDAPFVRNYCDLIVDSFGPVTSDVRELRAYAQRYYPQYCAKVSKDVPVSQTEKLWRHILPHLRAELQFGHTKGFEEKARMEADIKSLPLHLRFLIVAGFFCSYNSSSMDAKMLSKRHDPGKKRAPHTGIKKKTTEKRLTMLGPQSFSFDRVYSGLRFLMEDVASGISPMQVQCSVRRLCDMELFVRVGHEDNLDYPKYKCRCSKEYVEQIAASIGLELNRYLKELQQ